MNKMVWKLLQFKYLAFKKKGRWK